MKNILRCGISSNVLKTIAIIAMVIDHVGFYFSSMIPVPIYAICRYIGRIAMPIFVYLLVQGFFHTKSFKKYITRMSILAVITQLLITILMLVNIKLVPEYTVAKQVYLNGNILFSFVISLGVMKLLHEDILIKKWAYTKNMSIKIILVAVTLLATIFIPLDYGIEVVILSILMYYIEKLRIKLMIEKNNKAVSVKSILLNTVNDEKIKIIYLTLILLSISTLIMYFNASLTVLLSILPIALYNMERGKVNMKYIYYIIFPLQHILLYSVAMLITLT